jgi:hypothetical protein
MPAIRAALAAALVLAIAAPAAVAAPRSCQQVDVELAGGKSEGSAVEIRATGIRCKPARRVARACLRGNVRDGWRARQREARTILTKGERRVSFAVAGGGGCAF